MAYNTVIPNYATGGPMPKGTSYRNVNNCRVNKSCNTPQNPRVCATSNQQAIPSPGEIEWRNEMRTAASVKSLYTGIPNYYPEMRVQVPINSLYGTDLSQSYPSGLGRNKTIGGGHYKMWPLTNSHIFETHDYTDTYFPRPEWRFPPTIDQSTATLQTMWTSK